MKSELLSLLSFAIGIAAYSVKELALHGKLRWSDPKKPNGFWGEESWTRKYSGTNPLLSPDNWYYRFFKLGVKERFPGSATFLVFLTDGMHLMQFVFFIFISLSFVPILGWTYGIAFWILAHVIHFLLYRTLQR